MPTSLTRRQVGLLLCGGAIVAGCNATTHRTRIGGSGPLRSPPEREVALAAPRTTSAVALEDALSHRHSVRSFTRAPVDDALLAQLLWAAQGQTRSWGGRTAPSAGALYPLDVYAVTADRAWRYVPAAHRAQEWPLRRDLRPALRAMAHDQPALTAAPVIVVVTGRPERTASKYGSRAARYVALEAGHATQNLLLQATALGLGGVCVGAFTDADVAVTLGLPIGQQPYYLVAIGHPAPGA